MTDKEAYEVMLKYCGGEEGLLKIRQMIHDLGVDGTVEIMVQSYLSIGKTVNDEFKAWMKQSYEYLSKLMAQPLN